MRQARIYGMCVFMVYLAGVVFLLDISTPVWAAAPPVKTQAPGYYRMMLGQFEITALYDGETDLDTSLLHHASADEIKTLLARMFIAGPKLPTSVNAYLINTGSQLVLVDAGAAKVFGPSLGGVPSNLKAAGYDPTQIDAVLITHMHGDHIGGLLDAAGKPAFPKAMIYVAQPESDFFLSPEVTAKAPAAMQPFFKLARDIAAPYQALGHWKTFAGGDLPIPGITAQIIPGHTPGHTAYEVRSGDQTLMIWGDLVHCMAIQMARPDVSIDFDTDQIKAVVARTVLFKRLAKDKTIVAGMHMPFPGLGRVRGEGRNTYAWVPLAYAPMR